MTQNQVRFYLPVKLSVSPLQPCIILHYTLLIFFAFFNIILNKICCNYLERIHTINI